MTKTDCRKIVQEKLKGLTKESGKNFSLSAENFICKSKAFSECDILLLYSGTDNEVSTDEILNAALKENKIAAFPKTIPNSNRMNFFIVEEKSDLQNKFKKGKWNILEPDEKLCRKFNLEEFYGKNILVIVPGVAFDLNGNRLGHGKGFYDVYLSSLKNECKKNKCTLTFAGLCFELQLMEEIPFEENDVKMNCIFTESKSYFFESTEKYSAGL